MENNKIMPGDKIIKVPKQDPIKELSNNEENLTDDHKLNILEHIAGDYKMEAISNVHNYRQSVTDVSDAQHGNLEFLEEELQTIPTIENNNKNITKSLMKSKTHQIDDYCGVCCKTFNSPHDLVKHIRKMHPYSRAFKGSVLSNTNKPHAVKRHLKGHIYARPLSDSSGYMVSANPMYSCELCGKTFNNSLVLKRHIQCKSCYTYDCEICSKSFEVKSKWQRHLTAHSNERPFKCPVCQKTYKYRSHLKSHLKSHSFSGPNNANVNNDSSVGASSNLSQEFIHPNNDISQQHKEYLNSDTDSVDSTIFTDIIEISKTEYISDDDIANTAQPLVHNPRECQEELDIVRNKNKDRIKLKIKHNCTSCKKIFNFERDLDKHAQLYHGKGKLFKAIGYRARFLNKKKQKTHPTKRVLKDT